MSTGRARRLIDDPRAVTVAVAALVAAGLWLALWQSMAAMQGVGGMELPGAAEPMAGMSGGAVERPGSAAMPMDGMPAEGGALRGSGTAEGGGGPMAAMGAGGAAGGAAMPINGMPAKGGALRGSGMAEGSGGSMAAMGAGGAAGGAAMPMDGMPARGGALRGSGMAGAAEGGGGPMAAMGAGGAAGGAAMPMNAGWSAALVGSTAAMWLLMMAAMMLPAMAPMMATYAGLAAREQRGAALAVRVGLFATGYFALWALFSVAAALGQLALREGALLTAGGTLATPLAAGVLLLAAGGYQFTPVKDRCLHHCRHPLHFLMVHWREGVRGALPVGARHGLYCFGCCIAFTGLMFVFGVMNVLWMAAIAAYFLAEKVLPRERLWGRATGAALMAAGAVVLAREVL